MKNNISSNIEFAKLLGINPSNATTCVKPGGLIESMKGGMLLPGIDTLYKQQLEKIKLDPFEWEYKNDKY